MQVHNEKVESGFSGTIIDLETIGTFDSRFDDSRRYTNIKPVIFGFIHSSGLEIHCAKAPNSIKRLNKKMDEIINSLARPFYAFNSNFERGVLFHTLGRKINFEKELNAQTYEKKAHVVFQLGIKQYDDPFNDDGKACMCAWEKGEIKKAIAHNRSCLLKEKDILLKRGCRDPDSMRFVKVD